MDSGLVTSLSGALAQSRRIETIANNIANADTPAFKERDLVFEEMLESAHQRDDRNDMEPGPLSKSEILARPHKETRPVLYGADFTNMRAGPMRQTGNTLDLAIEGNGFLEVLSPNGIRLTRAGNLSLDTEGRLVTRDGFLILGPKAQGAQNAAQNDPAAPQPDPSLRAIRVGTQHMQIDIEGNIYRIEEGVQQNVGRISIVQVENPAALKLIGGNLFEAGEDAFTVAQSPEAGRGPASIEGEVQEPTPLKLNPLGPTNVPAKIHQGMLEGSNVNPVQQMTRLIEAHRLYDQNLKIMQSVGQMNSQISEVGKF